MVQNRAEEKKREIKELGERGERKVSSPFLPPTLFSACFSLRCPHSVWRLDQAFLALADSAVAVRKNDTKTMNVLINN